MLYAKWKRIRSIIVVVAFLALLVPVSFAVLSNFASGTSSNELALDGSASIGLWNQTATISLTTHNSHDVIVLAFSADFGGCDCGIVSVSDSNNLSWAMRKHVFLSPQYPLVQEEWYAVANNLLSSDQIMVSASAVGNIVLTAFGISGANFASPFDSNSNALNGTSGISGNGLATISTSNPNDLIIGSSASLTGSGWSNGAGSLLVDSAVAGGQVSGGSEYKTLTSAQSNLTIRDGNNAPWVMIADALRSATSGTTISSIASSTSSTSPSRTTTIRTGSSTTSSASTTSATSFSSSTSSTTSFVGNSGSSMIGMNASWVNASHLNFSLTLSVRSFSNPYTYTVLFGDGQIVSGNGAGSQLVLSHLYSSVGTYTILMTIKDGLDNIIQKSVVVQIS